MGIQHVPTFTSSVIGSKREAISLKREAWEIWSAQPEIQTLLVLLTPACSLTLRGLKKYSSAPDFTRRGLLSASSSVSGYLTFGKMGCLVSVSYLSFVGITYVNFCAYIFPKGHVLVGVFNRQTSVFTKTTAIAAAPCSFENITSGFSAITLTAGGLKCSTRQ